MLLNVEGTGRVRARSGVALFVAAMLSVSGWGVANSRAADSRVAPEIRFDAAQAGASMAVDLSPEGWQAVRRSRTGLPFMKVESLLGVLGVNAWPSKVVVHSQYVRGGRVVRKGEKGIDVREAREFAPVAPLPLREMVPGEQLIASSQVVRASEFLACATGEHLTFDRSMFSTVDYRRDDALFVAVEPADPKMRERGAVRPLLIYFPALDGAPKDAVNF